MNFIVNMVRETRPVGGRDRFSCTCASWNLLFEIGIAFGWKPRGTTYVPAVKKHAHDANLQHDYQPGDHQDYKLVEADDAVNWAAALGVGRKSPHLAAMIGERSAAGAQAKNFTATDVLHLSATFPEVMDEFIEYAYGGAFSFARARQTMDA